MLPIVGANLRTRPSLAGSARVLLVGFEDQDNLGLRYLSSRLQQAGHRTKIVAFGRGAAPVLAAIREFDPHVVGFSLIFQFMVPQFRAVMTELREAGVTAHFTIGGHYASFEPEALLNTVPELDSVVRFEGEDTLVELAESVSDGVDWHVVPGIAHGRGAKFRTSEKRKGRENLDELPWPDRTEINYEARGLPTASVLGSRGCPWVCSFCSIITFYEGNGTKGRRRRDPVNVVDELEHLHRDRGVRIFLWQDDDFLAGGPSAIRWAHAVAAENVRRGLHRDTRWKLSCRSDEVRRSSLEPLVEAGLTHVYLGVESGDEDSLRHMNKRLKPEVHLEAGRILDELGLTFDFGFMLLEPWSTVESVRNNIRFLRDFVGDGVAPATFCRMLPYVGTACETKLREEGRLKTTNLQADYDFLDPRLDAFYAWMVEAFHSRNFTQSGTLNLLRLLIFESNLSLPDRPVRPLLKVGLRSLTAVNNSVVFDILDAALVYCASTPGATSDDLFLQKLTEQHDRFDARCREDIALLVNRLPKVENRAVAHGSQLV